jgi:signal transduction histidine kinase
LNLLQNALRATPAGGHVRVEVCRSHFRAAAGAEVPSIAIVVEDSGSGIPETLAGRIFEPFFTHWETAQTGGTGLGLTVVKSIVTDHGGAIELARPASGTGARFTVHFPSAGEGPGRSTDNA